MLPPALCMQSLRNFLRSLPCRPLASASFEHSMDCGECCLAMGADVAGGADVDDVCAKAGLKLRQPSRASRASKGFFIISSLGQALERDTKKWTPFFAQIPL